MGPHVQWNMSNVATYVWDLMYSGTCLMWSPVGPHVQWNLSNAVTHGTSSHGVIRQVAVLSKLKCTYSGALL